MSRGTCPHTFYLRKTTKIEKITPNNSPRKAASKTQYVYKLHFQIHLEADPSDYLGEEGIKSNEARLGIIHKIMGDILGLHVKDPKEIRNIDYTMGYFLGNHVVSTIIDNDCHYRFVPHPHLSIVVLRRRLFFTCTKKIILKFCHINLMIVRFFI